MFYQVDGVNQGVYAREPRRGLKRRTVQRNNPYAPLHYPTCVFGPYECASFRSLL